MYFKVTYYKIRVVCLFAFIMLMRVNDVCAQDHYIQGKVTNVTEGGKPFAVGTINLYFVKNQKEANEVASNLKKDHRYYETRVQEVFFLQPDENGYYVCEEAYPKGFIVVDVGTDVCQIFAINGLSDLDLEIAVEGKKLEEVVVEAKLPNAPVLVSTSPTLIGDQMFFTPNFALQGNASERLVFQTFVSTCYEEVDTVLQYYPPIVIEGKEFSITQERRMGYDASRDPLHQYVDSTLAMDGKYKTFSRNFQFTMPNPQAYYQLKMKKVKQHYTGIIESYDTVVCKCQREDPLQYFQYSFDTYSLDPLEYRPSSQLRVRNDADTVSLTFLVGKARLDSNNPNNTTEWNKIVTRLQEIKEVKGSRIQSFEIVGVSSPEGDYQSNLELAEKRAGYALQLLVEQKLLQTNTKTIYRGEVAGWEQVAAIMSKKDSIKGQEIANIVSKYESINRQTANIKKLPYYSEIKDSILPLLRCVRTSCNYMIRRNLKVGEVLEIYRKDPTFKFEPLEYWMLIQAIKNPDEKAEICKRTLQANKYDTPLRPFAANTLARLNIERGIVDTTLLAEFIYPQYRVNQELVMTNTYTKVYNPDVILANQVCMFLVGKHYFSAASLVRRIEHLPQYRELSLLVACLNGYYADNHSVFNANIGKDLINTIVLHLAMGAKQNRSKVTPEKQRYHNVEALKLLRELNTLPEEKQALGYYLKAVVYNRLDLAISDANMFTGYLYEEKPVECLLKCFELDESFIRKCQGDAYVRDKYDESDVRERDIFNDACARYYRWKDGDAELEYTVLDDMIDGTGIGAPDPTEEIIFEWGLSD